jgi:hypothetical protein
MNKLNLAYKDGRVRLMSRIKLDFIVMAFAHDGGVSTSPWLFLIRDL